MAQRMNIDIRAPSRLELSAREHTPLNINMQTGVSAMADYEGLSNKPRINGVTLSGDLGAGDLRIISEGTEAYWAANPGYLPRPGEIVIYTDHDSVTDEHGNEIAVPGIKIGDGNAYVADLPFTGDGVRYLITRELRAHTGDTGMHVTPEEKRFWNAKLNYDVVDDELIFTRN